MADDAERWLPIPWAPDYEVSARGRGRHLYAYLPRKSDGKSRLQDVVRIMNAVFDGETMP
jgi:hypothetical protein